MGVLPRLHAAVRSQYRGDDLRFIRCSKHPPQLDRVSSLHNSGRETNPSAADGCRFGPALVRSITL